ncbi:hypothetical protein O6H91_01G029400 [Diphasiastrum complanatum]|uniref:Uncharacterized protein n=3 Tax=Diphasiastrum complanatum TaxID=34168 RepID=A0ACC2EPL6_DIPCM|nr:hypothetical protein O6H91_01G029400 [Diphasiastrum complanatum]KAJ7568369.1 hypothetical protein O6H91_01G029400 [Diphasiastrum complanatum]
MSLLLQMKTMKEDSFHKSELILDVTMAVEELHSLNAREMKKLLKEKQNNLLWLNTGRGAFLRVDMERLAAYLPTHLMAYIVSRISGPRLRYLLRGVRLLHSLGGLALNHPKLEQILLQEVNTREQIIDFVIFLLVVLADAEQETRLGSILALFHSTLVACSLYLLTTFVTPDWRDVARVLLVHPKVDVFMDVAFDAVRRDIGLLQSKVRTLHNKLSKNKTTFSAAERVAQTIVQQCEASLQVLQSLCEPQDFRDQLLKHKELCKNGGILRLVLATSKLQLPSSLQSSKTLVAAFSRLKSKALAMLLKFCETESVSFLDEVAANLRSMHLAELIAGEVLGVVKCALLEKPVKLEFPEDEKTPMGSLYINSMRLVDVLSDDSNFRPVVIEKITPALARLLAMDPNEFKSRWCGGSSALESAKSEADALLLYDPFHAAGAAMLNTAFANTAMSSGNSGYAPEEPRTGCSLSVKQMQPDKYAQEQSTLLVKIFANLHCFNPVVCSADEKDRFLRTFIHCLLVGPLSPNNSAFFFTQEQTAARICNNLHVLLDHVASFSSEEVNDEDVQLVSQFASTLHATLCVSRSSHESSEEIHPLLACIRDAHCKGLEKILGRRLESERWKRIQQRTAELLLREQMASGAKLSSVIETEGGSSHIKGSIAHAEHQEEVPSMVESRMLPKDTLDMELPPSNEIEILKKKGVVEEVETCNNEEPEKIDEEDEEEYTDDQNSMDALKTDEMNEESLHSVRSQGNAELDDPNEESEEKHPKKRQRRIMSEKQISMMEQALKEEPYMQRFPKLIQQWTDTLNQIGPEITHNQLKNWLNNRKARLARIARETRSEGDLTPGLEKARKTRSAFGQSSGPHSETAGSHPDSPEGIVEDSREVRRMLKSAKGTPILKCKSVDAEEGTDFLDSNDLESLESMLPKFRIGQNVSLRDGHGNELAFGIVHQLEGRWQGKKMHEQGLCLVEITKLLVDNSTKLPFPSELTGTTFEEAENLLGKVKVAWKLDNIGLVQANDKEQL